MQGIVGSRCSTTCRLVRIVEGGLKTESPKGHRPYFLHGQPLNRGLPISIDASIGTPFLRAGKATVDVWVIFQFHPARGYHPQPNFESPPVSPLHAPLSKAGLIQGVSNTISESLVPAEPSSFYKRHGSYPRPQF